MLAHRKTWVAGLVMVTFCRLWPTPIIQSMTTWLNGMEMLLIQRHLSASA